jgi:class 3 adenylate cyclase/tetratricopeptide (TPR) repeat protein
MRISMSESIPPIESERRIATVMFADISGFTAMSEKMDPEQVTVVMNDCFRMMEHCIEAHGGMIDKFIGDCVMVLFGVPKALEDAPQKAVNTAIELRNRLTVFNREKGLAIPLNIHIGINTGPVISGMVGGDRKQDFTVMGDAVNLASRLEDASQTGQILVGPETYKATKPGFNFKVLTPITLKGKAEPVPVYELLSMRETLHRVQPGMDRMISSVLVGRDEEMRVLETHVKGAADGEGSIVNVIGEAGIGKSRIMAELKNGVTMKGVVLLEGRTVSMGGNLGYHLVIDLLRNWAGITKEDSERAAFAGLESSIRAISPDAVDEILPFVATLMGLKLEGKHAERVRGIEGESLEKLILKNVRDLITAGARRSPLVIVLEDLHWADASSLDLMEALFRLVHKERIVFINVFRPGYEETGDRIARSVREDHPGRCFDVCLQPLDKQQTGDLITNLLNISGFPHNLRAQIVERAGGNPYFVEEVVRSFIDEGAVVLKDKKFVLTDKLSSMTVPHSINEVLMVRIDRLDEKTRDLVRTASVIGRSFFYRILAEVARTVEDMDSRLDYLEEIQLIREQKRMEELEYLFKHALAQEVAYESILIQRRRELHKVVADSIEKVFSERLHEFYGMLAFHYSQAEDSDKAEEYLIRAGEESLKASASSEALGFFQKALELYLKKYGKNADPEKVAMLEMNIALALFNRGRYPESFEYFDRVLEYFGMFLPKNPLSTALKLTTGFFSFFISLYLPFLKWKRVPDSNEKIIVHLFHKKATALGVTNPMQMFIETICITHLMTKFDVKCVENGPGIVASYSTLFSWPGISFHLSRRILNFVRDRIEPGDSKSRIFYLFSELTLKCLSGDWPEKIELDLGLIERNLSMGEFFFTTNSVFWIEYLHIARGDFLSAQAAALKIHEVGEIYGNDMARLLKYHSTTLLLMKFRMLHEALKEADVDVRETTSAGFGIMLVSAYAFKARILLMLGDAAGAEDSLGHAMKTASGLSTVAQQDGEVFLGRLALDLHLMEEAIAKNDRSTLSVHYINALKSSKRARMAAANYAFFLVEALKLSGTCCWIAGKQRKALKLWRRSMLDGQRLNDRLELSRTYFEVGKRLLEPRSRHKELNGVKAGEYLEKARAMFEEMNLQWDLDELEKLKIQMAS